MAKTHERGSFSLPAFAADIWFRLAVTTADDREMRVRAKGAPGGPIGPMMVERGFVGGKTRKDALLVVIPAARVRGRVVTKLPGVSVAGLKVVFSSSRTPRARAGFESNFAGVTRTDAAGRFTLDGLNEGTIHVVVSDAEANAP